MSKMDIKFRNQTRDDVGQAMRGFVMGAVKSRRRDCGCGCPSCEFINRMDILNGMMGAVAGLVKTLFTIEDDEPKHGLAIARIWLADCQELLEQHLRAEGLMEEDGE